MHNTSLFRTACAALALIVAPSTAWSQSEPYGQPVGGWTFNQTPEGGAIKCRAILKSGNQTYVMGGSTSGGSFYVSVNAGNIAKGQYPGSSLVLASGNRNVTVTSDGGRMWFQLVDFDMEKVAQEGAFVLNVRLKNGGFGGGEMTLNKAAPKALDRLFECLQSNGG